MSEELARVEAQPLALRHELSVQEVVTRIKLVHQIIKDAMIEGHHYGHVPGIEKPILMKAGMELLCMMFRLDPQYETTELREGEHLTIKSTCTLWHIPTGQRWGSGQGSCSTRETRYAYRKAARLCPKCGKDAIIKGRDEYGGGWVCFKKKDGCGAKFTDGDATIESQVVGRVPNEDLADQYNTVLKMANKRAKGDAVLTVTAASDVLTVDMEDIAPDAPVVIQTTATAETIEEQGDRLFKTPGEEERAEKIAMLEPIAKGFQILKLTAKEQVATWDKHTGSATFLDPDGVTLDALTMLLDELRARHRAQESRKKL